MTPKFLYHNAGAARSFPPPDQDVQLAIATVPMQPWETPYEPSKALKQGTIFPCLDLPFFIVGGEKMPDRCQLLQQINEISFVVNDLNLFLDTHPTDGQALDAFSQAMAQRKQLLDSLPRNMNPLPELCLP